jgi:hypothetical protein
VPWSYQPTNSELLDALAADFAAHRFSLKHLMRTLVRSSAYQLSPRLDGKWKESYTPYFARHYVRQRTAEQIHDAISQATQVFGNYNRKDYLYGTPIAPVRFWTEAARPKTSTTVRRRTSCAPLAWPTGTVRPAIGGLDPAGDDAHEQPVCN